MAHRKNSAGELIPEALAYLGRVGSCVLHNPRTQDFFAWPARPGRILALAPSGQRMFILRPYRREDRVRPNAHAVHAMNLHEQFVHRRGNAFYNMFVPPFCEPQFAGELVILRYRIDKRGDGPSEYEHYFKDADEEPCYVELWSVGFGQYVIPPGPWMVTAAGVHHPDDDVDDGLGANAWAPGLDELERELN